MVEAQWNPVEETCSVVHGKVLCSSSKLDFLGNVGKLSVPSRLVIGVGGLVSQTPDDQSVYWIGADEVGDDAVEEGHHGEKVEEHRSIPSIDVQGIQDERSLRGRSSKVLQGR